MVRFPVPVQRCVLGLAPAALTIMALPAAAGAVEDPYAQGPSTVQVVIVCVVAVLVLGGCVALVAARRWVWALLLLLLGVAGAMMTGL